MQESEAAMIGWLFQFGMTSVETLWQAVLGLFWPALFFAALALILKKRGALAGLRRALPETATTLKLMVFNLVFVAPFLVFVAVGLSDTFSAYGIGLIEPSFWHGMPVWLVGLAAVFAGDFTGYWRHRFEHCRLLWPSHAIHHSDTHMTWLTLERFHPVNRLTTVAIDSSVLLLLGFPPVAVVINNLVRHYYGYFIHADLPWTYGPLGRVFVSPAMHRWHHAADPRAYGTNFATVFSVFDQAFGTYRVPGPCNNALGIDDTMGEGLSGQLLYPFRASRYRSGGNEDRTPAPAPAE